MAAKKDFAKKSLCISINLLPPEYRETHKDLSWITDRRIIWPTIALIAAIVGVYLLNTYITDTVTGLNNELERVRTEVEREWKSGSFNMGHQPRGLSPISREAGLILRGAVQAGNHDYLNRCRESL